MTMDADTRRAVALMWRTDGYKLGHRDQYPQDITEVYANLTPRENFDPSDPPVVVMAGVRRFLLQLQEDFAAFFRADPDKVADTLAARITAFSGLPNPDTSYVRELHDLGYLPLEIRALDEGALGLIGHPVLTIRNTDPRFPWLPLRLETWLSAAMWHPITAATRAWRMRMTLDAATAATGGDMDAVGFFAHDFSMRGLEGLDAAAMSGMAHLMSWTGSDSLIAVDRILDDYPDTTEQISGGVPASEHSVMTAGAERLADGTMDETAQINRLLDLYPTGPLSVVSDSYDFWAMMTETLPSLKDRIMARDGKYVVRPDSGKPIDVICGDADAPEGTPARRGALEVLWENFGGTYTTTGHRILDPHVGLIYGDSMNPERIAEILDRMEREGWAAQNVVFGVGSFTYQYVTRDTHGFAVKATWVRQDGKGRDIWKDPVTSVDVSKKSARGLLVLQDREGKDGVVTRTLIESATEDAERDQKVLRVVYRDGQIVGTDTDFGVVRQRLRDQTALWDGGKGLVRG